MESAGHSMNAYRDGQVHMWTAPICKKILSERILSLASICTAFMCDTKAAGQDDFRIVGSYQWNGLVTPLDFPECPTIRIDR